MVEEQLSFQHTCYIGDWTDLLSALRYRGARPTEALRRLLNQHNAELSDRPVEGMTAEVGFEPQAPRYEGSQLWEAIVEAGLEYGIARCLDYMPATASERLPAASKEAAWTPPALSPEAA